MFGHLYRILWNLRNLVDWLLQYFQIDFRFIRFNPNGHKENFSNFFPFSNGYEQCFSSINTLILHSFTSSKTFHLLSNIFKSLHSGFSLQERWFAYFWSYVQFLFLLLRTVFLLENFLLKNLRLMSVYFSMCFFSL